MSYFFTPPYYYKEFKTPESLKQPNIAEVMKHADEFMSFGELHTFKQYDEEEIYSLQEQVKALQVGSDLKQVLRDHSSKIFQLCIKVFEQLANRVFDDSVQRLEKYIAEFNLICRFLYVKQSYNQLEEIYTREINQLQLITQELTEKVAMFRQRVKELPRNLRVE